MADDARPAATVARPALAEVLASLSDCDALWWQRLIDRGWTVEIRNDAHGPTVRGHVFEDLPRWHIADPAAALEKLTTDGVLPQSWAGDVSRAFWCEACDGKGGVHIKSHTEFHDDWDWCGTCAAEDPNVTGSYVADGTTGAPATLPDLVAWASLGAATILAAEQLARETAARLRPWGVRPPVETATTPDGGEVEREAPWRIVWKVGAIREAFDVGGWPSSHRVNGVTATHAWADAARAARLMRDPFEWWTAHVESWPTDDPRPCPHEPALALLRMGLALDAITDDALVVVVPPLGDSNA